ncbi:MAG: hypothetical protein ACP5SP_07855, partial [Caldisericum sp.]|uniref:hypothetical protein n=1 Tax=Caldisericum sp. TaxID=2499687 RepID=UPI003D112B8E
FYLYAITVGLNLLKPVTFFNRLLHFENNFSTCMGNLICILNKHPSKCCMIAFHANNAFFTPLL